MREHRSWPSLGSRICDLICCSCAALRYPAKLRFDLHLLPCWSCKKGHAGLDLHRGANHQCKGQRFMSVHRDLLGQHGNFPIPKTQSAFHRRARRNASRRRMRVSNRDCAPFTIERGNPAQAPSGSAEIVSDDLPILHRRGCVYWLLRTVPSPILSRLWPMNAGSDWLSSRALLTLKPSRRR